MPLLCVICDKVLSTKSSYNRHLREVHNKKPEPVSYSSQEGKGTSLSNCCLEPGCRCTFKTVKNLVEHLQNVHLMKFEIERRAMENINGLFNTSYFYVTS